MIYSLFFVVLNKNTHSFLHEGGIGFQPLSAHFGHMGLLGVCREQLSCGTHKPGQCGFVQV